ncbi:hypothetical protein SAY87_018789 [Trapa incisa]|uniref:Uncharacterized protein n=1 Tax=Trapa incisa TaxID=236973 RepID=A0AAN7Q188_9MYRT|nr:hypothetical protein SAY87_018789 [Trapa incisa]
MAIPATMDIDEEKNSKGGHGEHDDDEHDHDMAEISLCRVYKRAGVGDYSNPTSHLLPQPLPATRAASSGGSSRDWDINGRQKQAASQQQRAFSSNLDVLKGSTQLMPAPPLLHLGEGSSSAVALSLTPRPHHQPMNLNYRSSTGIGNYENYNQHPKMSLVQQQQQQQPAPSSSGSTIASAASLQDDLHRLVNYHTTHHHHSSHHISSLLMTPQLQLQLPPQHQQLVARGGALQQPLATAGSFYERAPWEWNPAAPNQDCSSPYQPNMVNPFK